MSILFIIEEWGIFYLPTALKNEKSEFFRFQINKNESDPCRVWKTFIDLHIHTVPRVAFLPMHWNVEDMNEVFTFLSDMSD